MNEPEIIIADLLRTLYKLNIITNYRELDIAIDRLQIELLIRTLKK